MPGLAQQLFNERDGRLSKSHVGHTSKWPELDIYSANGLLPYIDYALARQLLEEFPDATQEAACFICHLSLASRNGHLCIRIEDKKVFPEPQTIWLTARTEEGTPPDFEKLKTMILQGAKELPKLLVSEMNVNDSSPLTPICQHGSNFYFQRNWAYETRFLERFLEIKKYPPELQFDMQSIRSKAEELQGQGKLQQEQADAIIGAFDNRLSIICGGPGTGKTYTAAYLIKTFWDAMTIDQKRHCEIALAAPTGKAAANLQKSLGRVMDTLEGFKPVAAKTLHALLGIKGQRSFHFDDFPILAADLILVDESSMIDVQLMVRLLSSIKPGARLVLLGDQHQLPPVGSGGLFADMIASLEHCGQPPSMLKTCLRAELKGILELAHAVNRGESDRAVEILAGTSSLPGVGRIRLEESVKSKKQALNHIIESVSEVYEYPEALETDPGQMLEMFGRFRILSPLRKGPFGVDDLNDKIRLHQSRKYRNRKAFLAPIMIQNNDSRLELFNGEVGVLVKFKNEDDEDFFHEGDYAIFSGNGNEQLRTVPAVMLPRFEYAYCLSVHKSQGSEFDRVMLLLPEGSEVFGREVLYTAITRARKNLEIYCEDLILIQTIRKQSNRLSGVLERQR